MVDFWIEIIIFIQKYWWLRSPYTNFDGNAWSVTSSGIVGDYYNSFVGLSYGRIIAGHGLRRLCVAS